MPVFYIRFSGITHSAADFVISELEISADGVNRLTPTAITANVLPSSGSVSNLIDANLGTEASWVSPTAVGTITLTYDETPLPMLTHVRQGSGATAPAQISGALIEQSADQISWTSLHSGSINSTPSANSYGAWTPLTPTTAITENITDTASTSESFEDNLFFLGDTASSSDSTENWISGVQPQSDVAVASDESLLAYGYVTQFGDSATAADTAETSFFTLYVESAGLTDILLPTAYTSAALIDTAALTDIIRQSLDQIVADTASGSGVFTVGAALALADIANAVAVHTPGYTGTMLVAEIIATLETYNGADGADVVELGVLSDAYVARVNAIAAILEAVATDDDSAGLLSVYQRAVDQGAASDTVSSAGSVLGALLADGAIATVRLAVGGELFTGWVLNAETLAPSEYQFTDIQVNSACRHGDRYLMAADDGIYTFTEDASVEAVMTYIKTGKMDFGSDMRKRVINSYIAYSATGEMELRVTTSENGQVQTNRYALVPFASDEAVETQRSVIGKGIKSRFWQFELIGEDVDCTFDEIGFLPVVLSRRI